jgi:hypothetical protein
MRPKLNVGVKFRFPSSSVHCVHENVSEAANKDQRGNGPHDKYEGHGLLLIHPSTTAAVVVKFPAFANANGRKWQ